MEKIIIEDNLAKTVTLTLTECCNLRCGYCYEEHKSHRTMSWEVAKEILDKELNEDDYSKAINFELFGGEPFLEFELIKKIVDYLKSNKARKPFRLFVTTNGTLVHGEVQDWLKRNRCIIECGLSLDGTKEMHDINRDNSFDQIDLPFFIKTYPQQPVKMTISKESLPFLCEGVKFCHKLGFLVNCNLAYGIDWSSESNVVILERELKKLIDFYIENPNIKPCSILDSDIKMAAYDVNNVTTRKWCGTGTHMHTYDVDGNVYPCQFFTPLSAGEELSKKSKGLKFYEEIPDELLDEKCKDCVVKMICPTCYGSNYISTGDLYHKDDNMCKLTKITMLARSYFRALQIEKGQINLSENDEQALIRSILKIQEKLKV